MWSYLNCQTFISFLPIDKWNSLLQEDWSQTSVNVIFVVISTQMGKQWFYYLVLNIPPIFCHHLFVQAYIIFTMQPLEYRYRLSRKPQEWASPSTVKLSQIFKLGDGIPFLSIMEVTILDMWIMSPLVTDLSELNFCVVLFWNDQQNLHPRFLGIMKIDFFFLNYQHSMHVLDRAL